MIDEVNCSLLVAAQALRHHQSLRRPLARKSRLAQESKKKEAAVPLPPPYEAKASRTQSLRFITD